MKHSKRIWVVGLVVLAGIAVAAVTAIASGRDSGTKNNVLAEALAVEQGAVKQKPHHQAVSAGVVNAALDFTGALEKRADAAKKGSGNDKHHSNKGTQGCQNTFGGGGQKNIRVNQDCSLRRQAEEVIAVDPTNPDHLIAGQNDSRIGFNHCGYDWSFDGGKTWGDQVAALLPVREWRRHHGRRVQ